MHVPEANATCGMCCMQVLVFNARPSHQQGPWHQASTHAIHGGGTAHDCPRTATFESACSRCLPGHETAGQSMIAGLMFYGPRGALATTASLCSALQAGARPWLADQGS